MLRATLIGIISGGTDWTDDQNWSRIEELVRTLPDGPADGPADGDPSVALRAWKQDFRDVSDRPGRMAPTVAIGELEIALRKDLGDQGRLQLAHGRYIVDTGTGEIVAERARRIRTLQGQPRRIGNNREWVVWVPSQAGGPAEPGDRVDVRRRNGQARTRTIRQVINSTKGGQNVRAD